LSEGLAGAICVGINGDIFDVIFWEVKKFYVSFAVKIKSSGVVMRLATVYGSPYEEGKNAFLSDLHELFLNWDGPAMIAGDFNPVRC
jgi:hypothetical protein